MLTLRTIGALVIVYSLAHDASAFDGPPSAEAAASAVTAKDESTLATSPKDRQIPPAELAAAVPLAPPEKIAMERDYRLVPMTPEEMQARQANNPKKDGALVRMQIDHSVPLSADSNLPNHYYYHGEPVPLALDKNRIAVRVATGVDLGQAHARTPEALGLHVTDAAAIGIEGWSLVTLAQPLVDHADANSKINAALQAGTVEFASPVFKSPVIADGWIAFAPDVLVRFKPEHGQRAAGALAELAGDFQIKEQNFGGMAGAFRLSGTPKNGFEVLAAANRLAKDPRVKWAEPQMTFSGRGDIEPNDPEMGNLWGLINTGQGIFGSWGTNDMDMDADEAWEISRGISSVRVLVIDTGVQQDHPDINQDGGRDFTGGQADGVAGGGPMNACDHHGTAVAGCISARWNNNTGVVGIAPLSRVVSARCMVANTPTCGPGWTADTTWTVNALNWAVNNGIQVSNNSNSYGATSDALDDAYLNAYESGMTHFASTGNSGASSIAYPASADTVNAVGNITNTGARNGSSQWGTGIDFSAPGTSIRTTDRTGSVGYDSTDYAWVNGTSFASPYAAGVAALVKTTHPNWNPINIETAMKSGATDLGSFSYDTTFGWGLVNAFRGITIFGPGNDVCTNPTVITGTVYTPGTIFTYSATTSGFYEPSESCEAGNVGVSNSVWYSFTPPANGTIDVNTWGSDYDTVLSVFDGCNFYLGTTPLWFATQLGCNDDNSGTLQSQILGIPVTGGQEYRIKVADYDTAPGGGQLDFDLYFYYGAPANDSCLNRTPIPSAPGSNTMPWVFTGAATVSPGTCTELWEYGCGHPDGNSNSVYYSFVPTASGSLSADTFGSDYDTVLTIIDGSGFSNPCGEYWQGQDGPICVNPIDFGYYTCNDDSYNPEFYYQSVVANYPVNAGWPYVIKVSDYNPANGGGWLRLNTYFVVAPIPGDVNSDGAVNLTDVPYMIDALLNPGGCGGCNMALADMNGDAAADGADLQLFVGAVLGM